MALPPSNLFPRIVHDPRILGGEPTVKRTRISVRIIVLALRYDRDIDHLLEGYPTLDRESVEQALAFYEANRAEIDQHIRENQDDAD